MKQMLLSILALTLLLVSAPMTMAIEVAIPSDFPAFAVTDNDPANEGYYISSSYCATPYASETRPYSYIFDARGNLVWFFGEPDPNFNDSNLHYGNGQIILANRSTDRVFQDVILDTGFAIQDTIPFENPHFPHWKLKWHEAYVDADGNTWSVWDDPETVDMSLVIEGGDTACVVTHSAIQKWDPDHNLLWSWSSFDHVDQLPYRARPDTTELLGTKFNHLHLNSFQPLDNGDVVCNGRVANLVFRIDGTTGNLEWGLGGWGTEGEMSSFDIMTNLVLPPDVAVGFTRGHDARLNAGDIVTIYDNGTDHQDPYTVRSYAKSYQLDFNNMTAELIWYQYHPDEFAAEITGSHRILANGNHLIGWGGGKGNDPNSYPTVQATEVTDVGDTVWEIIVYSSPEPVTPAIKTYRWLKVDTFDGATTPYLCLVPMPNDRMIELACNWFGHEDVIDSYNVYVAYNEGEWLLAGNTSDGMYTFNDIIPVQPYWFQVEPLDVNGDPVGPMSNVGFYQGEESGMWLTPLVTNVPNIGGNLLYGVNVVNAGPAWMLGLTYQTEVVIPNGNTIGPLMQVHFNLFAYTEIEVSNLSVYVNPFAPEGDYTFVANVLEADNVLWTDSFGFTKGTPGLVENFNVDADAFVSSGDLSPFFSDKTVVADTELPTVYEMNAAYPNPFNPTTTINVALPDASDLNVSVYNVTGQLVATLANGTTDAGTYNYVFDANGLASGLYFIRATVPGKLNAVQKVMLVR